MSTNDIRSLHEPLSRTGSGAYSALCTVVQAFPLAVIFWVIAQEGLYEKTVDALNKGSWSSINWEVVVKTPLVIAVVAVVWHRYVVDNNFMSWRLTWVDAAIPFSFSFIQCFLALAIRHSPAVFMFWVCAVTAMACLSYRHALRNVRTPHSRALFASHFGSDRGEAIHKIIEKYFADALKTLMWCAAATAVIYVVCASDALARARYLDLGVVTVTTIVIVVIHFAKDSSSCLKDFFDNASVEAVANVSQTDQRGSVKIVS